MLNELLSMIRQYDMLRPGDKVVCCVSGGADSVALLFALHLLSAKLGITLEAAHFNHQLRGEESRRDAEFVRELCRGYGIPLHMGEGRVVPGKKGLEAAARDARYAFFHTLEGKIATAHTADDNAETVLMRMVRGTGLRGLGGISPVRGRIIRPMLTVTREQVKAFLEEYCLDHVEDSSNGSDAFLRNRLRHRVLPELTAENPKFARNLSRMALRLRQDEQALCRETDFSQGLALDAVENLSEGEVSRVVGAFLEYCGVREPESAHIRQAKRLLYSDNPSARGDFPGGVTLCRQYDRLVAVGHQEVLPERTLNNPGVTEFPELGFRVICQPAQSLENGPDRFTVVPVGALRLRPRQSGDRLRLPGGMRSVKKLFIDRKIPAQQRQRIPILADEEGILGIYGIGTNRDRQAQGLPAVTVRLEYYET